MEDSTVTAGAAPTALTRAMATIRDLRRRLSEQQDGAVAVVGVGLRLPGGISTLDGYWDALAAGRDLVRRMPRDRMGPFARRWEGLPQNGSFLDEVLDFDAGFFGISPNEARRLDPQHRLLLEVSWEALENAAIPADRLAAGRTGFYLGIMWQDYREWDAGSGVGPDSADLYWTTGNGHNFAAGRVAHALGFTGPTLAVDTACSSSLVAVHLAVQALRRGECDAAFAAGVNLIMSPETMRLVHRTRSLSPDGRCKPFDARANGFVRGEGCGVVVLKRLDQAVRDGDRVLAVIHGSAVNQDGRAGGFTAPNVLAQADLIEAALASAGLTPSDIGYVEAHGTGTSLGDPIEMEALATALGRRNGGAPLPVGAVKANLGHLESAAGVAGLAKAVLCLRQRQIPPVPHLRTLNPRIDLSGTGITVPTSLTDWPEQAGRYAGVSSFGMSGTNAHIILGAPEPAEASDTEAPQPAVVEGFEVSAKTVAALRDLARVYAERLERLDPADYPAFASTATDGRARHEVRARITAGDPESAAKALRTLAAGTELPAVPDEPLAALPRRVVDLPTYPWQRERFAPGTDSSAAALGHEIVWEAAEPEPVVAGVPVFLLGDDSELISALRAESADVKVVADVADVADLPDDAVVVVTAAPAPLTEESDGTAAAARYCAQVSAAVAAAADTGRRRVFAITRQTRRLTEQDRVQADALAAVNGLSPVLGLESGAAWGGVVDIPAESSISDIRALLAFIAAQQHRSHRVEDAAAIRDGKAYVARLRPASEAGDPLPVDPAATYVVTGGLGAVGRELVQELLDRGARHLLLIGRRAEDALDPVAYGFLAEARAGGADVRYVGGGCGTREAVASALASIGDLPAVRGVVHAAGSLRRVPARDTGVEDYAEALGDKAAGAWWLHQATSGSPLDFFVLVSSVSAVWGTAECAAYSAANAALDALAAYRRSHGLAATSIAYGPWQLAGAGLADAELMATAERLGIKALTPREGRDALVAGSADAAGHRIACRLDLDRLRQTLGGLRPRGLFAPDAGPAAANSVAGPTRDADPGAAASAGEPRGLVATDILARPEPSRLEAVRTHIAGRLAAHLGHDDAARVGRDVGFFDLGLDSVTAVDVAAGLSADFDTDLAAADLFDHPTVDRLGEYVLPALGRSRPAPAQRSVATGRAPAAETVSGRAVPGRTETAPNEPVAIVGMAGRFPQADSVEEFWDLLISGKDGVGAIPPERFDTGPLADRLTTDQGGFLRGVDRFDAAFFGIPSREAESLDPQQRLLLESSWHALEDAGIDPRSLRGSRTGVFVGVSYSDYARLLAADGAAGVDAYYGTGTALNAAAGRLAFVLGLSGPALAVDTACSSSLVALHLAVQALRRGEADLALAGGVNVLLDPASWVAVSQAHMLAPGGRCRPFSADADGFVRAEGCGVLTLKRLSDARRAGDRVLAVIRGTAVNQDGASSGLTAPNGTAQAALLTEALADAGVRGADVSYLEAHGTGTALGDPVELGAAWRILGPGREPGRTLRVGSVKSSIGHCESAAGVAGVIKTVLALRNAVIPANLHFGTPNPQIPWAGLNAEVVTAPTAWSAAGGPRVAGVSGFGFSGTNAHVVLGDPAEAAAEVAEPDAGPGVHLIPLSAPDENGLERLTAAWSARLSAADDADLPRLARIASVGRAHFAHRRALLGRDRDQLLADLGAARSPGREQRGERPKVAFLFSGQGSQYPGMGRELYESEPVFREAFDRCAAAARAETGIDLVGQVLYGTDAAALNETRLTQPALVALQVALAAVWRSWGVVPAAVIGHSVGEMAAAICGGVMTPEEGIRLAVRRGALMQDAERGAMLAVAAAADEAAAWAADRGLDLAAVNGPQASVIAGSVERIDALAADLKEQGVRCRKLAVSHAFHSRLLDPVLEDFAALLAGFSFDLPHVPVVSNVSGLVAEDSTYSAEYWVRHARQPVRFHDGMKTLADLGIDLCLELGPDRTLVNLAVVGGHIPAEAGASSLRRGTSEAAALRTALKSLYTVGCDIDWRRVYEGSGSVGHTDAPRYPFAATTFWPRKSTSPRVVPRFADGSEPPWGTPLRSPALSGRVFASMRSADYPAHLTDHRLFGTVSIPGASHTANVLSAFGADGSAVVLRDLYFPRALVLPEGERYEVQIVEAAGRGRDGAGGEVTVQSLLDADTDRWQQHLVARIDRPDAAGDPVTGAPDVEGFIAAADRHLTGEAFYAHLAALGYALGPSFRWLSEAWIRGDEALIRFRRPEDPREDPSRYAVHPGLLDSCLQSSVVFAISDAVPPQDVTTIAIPFACDRVALTGRPGADGPWWGLVRARRGAAERDGLMQVESADVTLFGADDKAVLDLTGFRFRLAPRSLMERSLRDRTDRIFELRWQADPTAMPRQSEPGVDPSARIAVLGDAEALGDAADRVESAQNDADVLVDTRFLGATDADSQDALRLAVALAEAIRQAPPHVPYVVLADGGDAGAPVRETLWGLLASAEAELAERRLIRLELAPGWTPAALTAVLAAAAGAAVTETRLRLDADGLRVARLVPVASTRPEAAPALEPGSAALITGGLGALGLATARYLADRGIRAITLMGRGEPGPAALEAIAELEASGVTVTVVRGDVADPAACREAVAAAGRDAPLKTVLHLAGSARDRAFETLAADDFEAVFAAKAYGADTLAAALAGHELTAFVAYSSASTVIGTAGQANYAAANGYLNGLMARLRAEGTPAVAAAWGPWTTAAGGMASSPAVARAAAALAVSPLTDDQAAEALDRVLAADLAQPVVIALDAAGHAAAFAGHPRANLVRELIPAGGPAASQPSDNGAAGPARGWLARQLAGRSGDERQDELRAAVQRLADAVIGEDGAVGADVGFAEAGLDSIMVIDLRTRLAEGLDLDLPATVAIDHPTIDRLAAYLDTRLDGPDAGEPPRDRPAGPAPGDAHGPRDTPDEQQAPPDLAALTLQELIEAVQADVGDRT